MPCPATVSCSHVLLDRNSGNEASEFAANNDAALVMVYEAHWGGRLTKVLRELRE